MPRIYIRKTNRGNTPEDVMEAAAELVNKGESLRSTAELYTLLYNNSTLLYWSC